MSQKHIGSLARPFKVDRALVVQLLAASSKGQSSSERRPSAPYECSEGRWVSNQGVWLPGMVQEAIACFAVLARSQIFGSLPGLMMLALPLPPCGAGSS